MTPLPPPKSFAEGQRLIYGWLAAAAGMFCGAMAIALIVILVWGHWPTSLYGQIVTILGCALGGFIAAMSAVIIGLMIGGPVGRFSAKVGKDGVSLDADSDRTVKATVEVAPTSPSSQGD